VHYLEPVEGNENAIGLDLYTSLIRRKAIDQATSTWKPAISDRIILVQEADPNAYSIILFHLGVPVTSHSNRTKPTELATIVIRMPALLARSAQLVLDESLTVYLFDHNDKSQSPLFLGGVVINDPVNEPRNLTALSEKSFSELPENSSTRHTERII
jgi:CHASE domain